VQPVLIYFKTLAGNIRAHYGSAVMPLNDLLIHHPLELGWTQADISGLKLINFGSRFVEDGFCSGDYALQTFRDRR
jgi:hypothetical protein